MRKLFLPILGVLVVLWAGVTVAYHRGATGVRFGRGATAVSFSREHDATVLGVRDGVGLKIDAHGPSAYLSLVKVEPGVVPFCWLCGRNELAGGLINGVGFRSGAWLYRAPEARSVVKGQREDSKRIMLALAYNLETGELVSQVEGETEADQVARLGALGLVADDSHRLAPAALADLEPLAMLQESCMVFNAAFILLVGGWLIVGLVVLLRGRRRG